MDSFSGAVMRDEPGHECVRAAIEARLERHPATGAAEAAERGVGRLVDAARQEVF